MDFLRNIVDYRSMVWNFIKREIRGRYKGSFLGFLWNFITPLIQILVYIAVFSTIFKPNIPNYPLYLTAGMVVWIYFSDSLSEGSWVLMGNSDMLKKIYFPRAILPVAQVLSKSVNYTIMIVLYLVIAMIVGHVVDIWLLLLVPVFSVMLIVFIIGITLLVSALDVFFRDIQYIITVLLMALVWLTPIMYVKNDIDSPLLTTIIDLNPVTYYVDLFQKLMYWNAMPSLLDFVICLSISVITLLVGALVFKHLEKDFAEVL